jgi:hypothetical protein
MVHQNWIRIALAVQQGTIGDKKWRNNAFNKISLPFGYVGFLTGLDLFARM